MMKTRVSRCLFGPVNHDHVQSDLKDMLHEITQESCRKWNFDFMSETPMRGYFDWAPAGETPTFYRQKCFNSKSVQGCDNTATETMDLTTCGLSYKSSIEKCEQTLHNAPDVPVRVPPVYIDCDTTPSHSDNLDLNLISNFKTNGIKDSINNTMPLEGAKLNKSSCNLSSAVSSSVKSTSSSATSVPSTFCQPSSLFVPISRCKSANGVVKRRTQSPRKSPKKLRLTPITNMFKCTKTMKKVTPKDTSPTDDRHQRDIHPNHSTR